jgi:hypothetical protein
MPGFVRGETPGVLQDTAQIDSRCVSPFRTEAIREDHGRSLKRANTVEELWVTNTNPTAPTTGTYSNQIMLSGMTDRGSQVGFYPAGFPNLY